MRKHILPVFAILVLLGFLGILVWEVPRLDLGAVVAVTLLFAIWDLLAPHDEH
ncbi:hypothetical protein [Roseitranquillus sediminis]|uniref:hypothetical protein n=1 Tax=Roseitranquillus sediminis TaxID=2809051 RepID=UPI001D0CBA32|nr:hypothetical protein [Roseitranquillus sediminis]MBM9596016.1 hypothetical protein [Roseitranquillus sediminis]